MPEAAEGKADEEGGGGGYDWKSMGRMLIMYMLVNVAVQHFIKGRNLEETKPTDDLALAVQLPPHGNIWTADTKFDATLFLHTSKHLNPEFKLADLSEMQVWHGEGYQYSWDNFELAAVNITIAPALLQHLLQNGSVYGHFFATRSGSGLFSSPATPATPAHSAHAVAPPPQQDGVAWACPWHDCLHVAHVMNVHKPAPKVHARKRLLSGEFTDERVARAGDVATLEPAIVNWWKGEMVVNMMVDHAVYPANQIPPQFKPSLELHPETHQYRPPLIFNEFWALSSSHVQINDTVKALDLALKFEPISMLKWQMQKSMQESWEKQQAMGTQQQGDQDEMKRMMLETNPILLAVTGLVSLLHMVFDCLAFKNDVQFWKKKKSMKGLSTRTVLINCVCQAIIFLYLLENDTSWMIRFSSGMGLMIELWKVTKAAHVCTTASFPFVSITRKKAENEEQRLAEDETDKIDAEAIRYLSWVLYPLVLCRAAYGLVYEDHVSWYSWVLGSLVGAVYTFGFILMCPQLYLNYKLKSVAHLPWRMLTYKALNTFIDDLFAFIITMPTLHRLSCLRDDIIFFIFLYQKWKYRIDYSRVNEYGFQPDAKKGEADPKEGEADQKEETTSSNSDAKPASRTTNGAEEHDDDEEDGDAKGDNTKLRRRAPRKAASEE